MADSNRIKSEHITTDPDTTPVLIGGARDVRGTLTDPGGTNCVVACPPHPQMGGTRSDRRLTAVCNALGTDGIASLRFDYGEWDEGRGEYTDTLNALNWATERYERVGVYGFSFGGTLALVATGNDDPGVACVCALAPGAQIAGLDAVDALQKIDCPTQIVYGERDTTADWELLVDRATDTDHTVVGVSADHFFVGQTERIAERVATFFQDNL